MHFPRTYGGWRAKRSGDQAFDLRQWSQAETCYNAALARDPHMITVWIRLGQAQLKNGDLEAAERSYTMAASSELGALEPLKTIIRSARTKDEMLAAASSLLASSKISSDDFGSLLNFVDWLPEEGPRWPSTGQAGSLSSALPTETHFEQRTAATLLLDVTELLVWFRSFRLPSGVQRVQIGVIEALLADAHADAAVCRFNGTGWHVSEPKPFLTLLSLSHLSADRNDPAWREALLRVHLGMSGSEPAVFGADTVLTSLGAWVTTEFMDAFDAIRRNSRASYLPLIYDLIPILRPDWFSPEVGFNFRNWLDRLSATADAYLTISESTKRDLVRLSAERGHLIDPALVTAMRLDADFRGRSAPGDSSNALARYELLAGGYVLFVATIEPRKNHVGAVEAWRALIDAKGIDYMPTLVFVGHGGWRNEELHRLLAADERLRSKVKMISGVADADLGALYAGARFTVYPSFYEGWGLPVTESLCHGKAAVVARNSSLTEAGGDFVDYFDVADQEAFNAVINRLVSDDDHLARRELEIAERFSPRSWRALAADLEHGAQLARCAVRKCEQCQK